jgi:hypothetical protein
MRSTIVVLLQHFKQGALFRFIAADYSTNLLRFLIDIKIMNDSSFLLGRPISINFCRLISTIIINIKLLKYKGTNIDNFLHIFFSQYQTICNKYLFQ